MELEKKYCIVYAKSVLKNYNSGLVATLKFFLGIPEIKKLNAVADLDDTMEDNVIILFHIILNEYQQKKVLKLKEKNVILHYFTDNHNESFLKMPHHIFHRVLVPDNVFLKEMYPDIGMKSVIFPWLIRYRPRENIPFMKRSPKALIFGSTGGANVYPLRKKIRYYLSKVKNGVDLPRSKNIVKQDLMNYLGKYQIIIVTKGAYPLNYMLYKYVEAFISGALVFCEYVPLLEKLKYKPYVHYIPLKSNMSNPIFIGPDKKLQTLFDLGDLNRKITRYINNPESEEIIDRCMKLTNEKFGIKNRNQMFQKILKGLKL